MQYPDVCDVHGCCHLRIAEATERVVVSTAYARRRVTDAFGVFGFSEPAEDLRVALDVRSQEPHEARIEASSLDGASDVVLGDVLLIWHRPSVTSRRVASERLRHANWPEGCCANPGGSRHLAVRSRTIVRTDEGI